MIQICRPGSLLVLTMATAWATAWPALACDPNHDFKEVRAVSRPSLSDRALASLVKNLLFELEQKGQSLPKGSTVAVIGVQDARPAPALSVQGGALTLVAAQALESPDVRVVPAARTAQALALRKIGPEARLGADVLEDLARTLGATHFLRIKVTDAGQLVRLEKDVSPGNQGRLFRQWVNERARGRMSLQEASGRFVYLQELQGLCRDGYLYMARTTEGTQVEYFVEYHLDRPGGTPLEFQRNPAESHLQL